MRRITMKSNEEATLVELVEELSKIKVTPEKLNKNQGMMSDNNGGMIEY